MYLSQALNEHELKYGITDKEGCAVVWAVSSRRMRPWLISNQVILITDHSSLVALKSGKELKSMRQQMYAMDLSEFNTEMVHREGALLHTPDALSRLGYSKVHADSVMEQLWCRPKSECTVEKPKPMLEMVSNGEWLSARLAAVESSID